MICNYRTCQQGNWADCWMLSALTSLGYHRPDAVNEMVQPLDDGSFVVSLPNKDAIVVRPEEGGGSTSEGNWVAAVEAAVQRFTNAADSRVLSFGAGISILTGRSHSTYTNVTGIGFAPLTRIFHRREWFVENVAAATSQSRVVILGGSDGYWTEVKVPGLINRHCYALLAYEGETGTCRIRDPRGLDSEIPQDRKRDGYGPGEFWLTPDEVEASFCGLSFEKE